MYEAVEIFLSYSRKDDKLLQDLKIHLEPLRLSGHISIWHDGQIVLGQEWDDQIKKNLSSSKIILLLISKDFINSKYIQKVELKVAYERHEKGDTIIIPVILRDCAWKVVPFGTKCLGDLQALPRNVKPIVNWSNRDRAFTHIVEEIQYIIEGKRSEALTLLDSFPEIDESSLSKIWADVVAEINPLGTRSLMHQQGTLIFLDGSNARIGFGSKPLFKMAQGRIENVKNAFQKVLNRKIQVSLEIFPEETKGITQGDPLSLQKQEEGALHNEQVNIDDFQVGKYVMHTTYGTGEITHIFGAGTKICLAIKFSRSGRKIIDPKITSLILHP
jgi:hypothetical protein